MGKTMATPACTFLTKTKPTTVSLPPKKSLKI